ncbi:MAG TPA: right-handed parallel beta-helix repeat-containing protein [Polyangia bacterium]|jgi:hypothetical protein
MSTCKISILGLVLAAGCAQKGSLVFVTVDSGYAIADAARLHVALSAAGRSMASEVPLSPTTFPPAHSFAVDVGASTRGTLMVDAQLFDSTGAMIDDAMGSVAIAAGGRADLTLTFRAGAAGDMGGDDLAAPPGSDLAVGPDMATCVPATASQTLWVDPTLGIDDAFHGAAPGACANKTITFALTHGTGHINLNPTATYSTTTGETFPITLGGTQILDGDPNNTGTLAKIFGYHDGTYPASIVLSGTLNQLLRVDDSIPTGSTSTNMSNIIACVHITTAGGHVLDHDSIHDCQGEGVEFNQMGGSTLTNDMLNNVDNGLNGLGAGVTVKNCTIHCNGDGINGCPSISGCGNTITFQTVDCNACPCPNPGFEQPCP